jgi:hypothetical protein
LHRLSFLALPLTILFATASGAQSAPRYRIADDTLRYEIDNPFRMYWLKGDTIGPAQHGHEVESHVWGGSEIHPTLVIRQLSLEVGRRTKTDTFDVAPSGRVEAINHRTPGAASRVDLLLRLPSSPLVLETRWSDTVRVTGTDPGGAQWYEVARDYRVARVFDTVGTRGVADVSASGTIRMRFGFWVDSAAGKSAWIDVTGRLLPYHQKVIHARWSGEAAWIPLGDFDLGVGYENHTSHPSRGDLPFYPSGISETEILFPYGSALFASRMGQLAGNHFLTVIEGRERLAEMGRLVLWHGAQDIIITPVSIGGSDGD